MLRAGWFFLKDPISKPINLNIFPEYKKYYILKYQSNLLPPFWETKMMAQHQQDKDYRLGSREDL